MRTFYEGLAGLNQRTGGRAGGMGHHVATLVALPERDPCRQGMAGVGAAVSHAMERPKPERRNAEEAHLLGIPRGAPVLRIE